MSGTPLRVVVVGLGAMGSATAFQLARRGAAVTGLEAYGPAHNRGSSHGESRIIRQAYFEGPAYVPLVLRAYQLWRELEFLSKERLLETTGGVMIGSPHGEVVTGSLESARLWDIPHRLLTAAEVEREFPALHPQPDQVGLVEPEAGVLAPELAVLVHLRQAATFGAELHFGEKVIDWEAADSGVVVRTQSREYQADRLVLTAGAWSAGLLRLPELDLQVERQVMLWFAPTDIKLFTPPLCPIYLFERFDGTHYYGVPTRDGRTAKVARHHGGECTSADDVRRGVTEADVAGLREGLTEGVPELAGAPLAKSATCLYTNSPDHNFVVELHPSHPQVALAAGFSGHGFKFCPVLGEALADLAELGETAHPIGDFNSSRFKDHQSGGKGISGSGGTPTPRSDITSPIK
ncbi:MAG TPA: N-methyl-L-tryptophan oxidase [Candidatus Dormibacteraeota bacterium]|nr:N-methyl-L-tryptophan oxidase [Candidatus Dormibacteraeota bacterium]